MSVIGCSCSWCSDTTFVLVKRWKNLERDYGSQYRVNSIIIWICHSAKFYEAYFIDSYNFSILLYNEFIIHSYQVHSIELFVNCSQLVDNLRHAWRNQRSLIISNYCSLRWQTVLYSSTLLPAPIRFLLCLFRYESVNMAPWYAKERLST